MNLINLLNGKKTYTAAIGLVVLAYYYYQQGNVELASQAFFNALGFVGLRHAMPTPSVNQQR